MSVSLNAALDAATASIHAARERRIREQTATAQTAPEPEPTAATETPRGATSAKPRSQLRDDAHDTFYRKRRAFLDQVVFDKSLQPVTRIVAVAIAQATNRDSGYTFIDPTTIALRLGLKRDAVVEAIKELKQVGHLAIEHRVGAKDSKSRGRTNLEITLKPSNDEFPVQSRRGSREYYKARAEWFEAILIDTTLQPSYRLVAMAIAAFDDPESAWCEEGARGIAKLLGAGISRATVNRAMTALHRRGHILLGNNGEATIAKMVAQGWHTDGTQVAHSHSDSRVNSEPSKQTLGDSVITGNIPLPTVTDRVAAPRGHGVDLDRFAVLYDLITNDYGKTDRDGYEYQTVGGILKISSGDTVGGTPYDDNFTPSEIRDWVNAGLLICEGQRVYISQRGCDAVERHRMAEAA
jgi:hypothetical protein